MPMEKLHNGGTRTVGFEPARAEVELGKNTELMLGLLALNWDSRGMCRTGGGKWVTHSVNESCSSPDFNVTWSTPSLSADGVPENVRPE